MYRKYAREWYIEVMNAEQLFAELLKKRAITDVKSFAAPDYDSLADPFLMPDMKKAISRISKALKNSEHVAVYGDYDIDGLTATTILSEALQKYGLQVETFIPDRFIDGYGMSNRGIDMLAEQGVTLLFTVDTGSLSHEHVEYAKTKNIDVIVTDHHTTGKTLPKAVAVINPKRTDSKYPYIDLAGVGVAFTVIRAMQQQEKTDPVFQQSDGLPEGQEKWLLDLVAMGTVCDVVPLNGENRILVYWGLKVMAQTKRVGLHALAQVSDVDMQKLSTETFGFRFGPRLNASGRMETAKVSLDLLKSNDITEASQHAETLQAHNDKRRALQKKIFDEAMIQAESMADSPVIIVAGEGWSHGVVGIVASKLSEQFLKPAFVLEIDDQITKGSARSFGDFHLAKAITETSDLIEKGGGHAYAAGVTMPTKNLEDFRKAINNYYKALKLKNQASFMKPEADLTISNFSPINEQFLTLLESLEPYGEQHERPKLLLDGVVKDWRPVGADGSHAKVVIADADGRSIDAIGFGLAKKMPNIGEKASIVFTPSWNEFRGRKSLQLMLLDVW